MRAALTVLLVVLGCFCVLASLLPFLPARVWWIRAFDFPRVQVAVLAGIVLVAYALISGPRRALGDAVFGVALLTVLVIQGYQTFPYTRLASTQAAQSERPDADRITLMIANVLLDNRDASRLTEMIRAEDPDIVLVVETDRWWLDQLDEFDDRYPYAVEHPLDNTYGIALYSKFELLDPEVRFLVEDDVPSIHARVRLAGAPRSSCTACILARRGRRSPSTRPRATPSWCWSGVRRPRLRTQ